MFSSLRNHNYRLFAAGQVVSNSGTWMQRTAQDWLVLDLSHGSGSALGIAAGLQFLPLLLFSLWGGAIADRFGKRRILLITQSLMGGLALILGLLAVTGTVRLWHVYLLAFALGMVTVVDNPTRQTFVTEMVGPADMANGIALNSAIFNLARIAGPALAGIIIGLVGTPIAFLINAASYGAVITGLLLMRPGQLAPTVRAARARGQVRETLRYLRGEPRIWLPMTMLFFVATFGMNFQVTTALMSRGVFHTGAGAFGLASTAYAVGALGGALLAARRRYPSVRLQVAVALAFGILEAASGLMPAYWAFLAAAAADWPVGRAVYDGRELRDPARHGPADTRPCHGRVHAGVPGRRADRVPAHRLGGRAVRPADEPDLGRGGLGGRGHRGGDRAGARHRDERARRTAPAAAEAATNERMRLFVALVPPPAVLGELDAAVAPLRAGWPGLSWTGRDAWHITLAFLGEVSEATAARLAPRLERATARHHEFRLAFAGAGAFPSATRARVFWNGLSGDVHEVAGLAASVAAAARRAGAPSPDEGRPFRPHLTLARCRVPADVRALIAALSGYRGPAWTADHVHLIHSRPGSQPRYAPLGSWPLGHR